MGTSIFATRLTIDNTEKTSVTAATPAILADTSLADDAEMTISVDQDRKIARDRDSPDIRRKALTAIAAKMARVVHAVIKSGSDYRPFFEGRVPGGWTPLRRAVRAPAG